MRSAKYGVEAYQAAWLKRCHPAEFMADVLTNAKGFTIRWSTFSNVTDWELGY